MPLTVQSYADMSARIASNLHKINREDYDVVVGIPRSGIAPAAMIATFLQLPFAEPSNLAQQIIIGRSNSPKKLPLNPRILLVDDSVNKGGAMAKATEQVRQALFATSRTFKITRLAVYGPYQVEHPEKLVDISLTTDVRGPRAFAWNMFKHIRLPRWGFDMDGVLCRDPVNKENDDGPRYLEFIKNAEPLFLPTRPCGPIVTARLEKYRKPTEDWLQRHRVSYHSLHMMPYANKAERMKAGNRGGWKAETFMGIDTGYKKELFIESSPKQSKIIAREAGLQVWCTGDQTLYGAPTNE